jgi:hypothetical protein
MIAPAVARLRLDRRAAARNRAEAVAAALVQVFVQARAWPAERLEFGRGQVALPAVVEPA